MKAGNDGRRPSGVIWNETSLMHAVRRDTDGFKTLCGREVGAGMTEKAELRGKTRPRCKCCEKRAQGIHVHT